MKWRFYFVLGLLVVLTPYAYMLRYETVDAGSTPAIEQIPRSLDGFSGSDEYLGSGTLRLLDMDESVYRVYTGSDLMKIWFFLSYYRAAQANSQIHSPKHCYPGAGWNIYGEGIQEINMTGRRAAVKRLYISDGTRRRVVFYWFATGSGIITDEFHLKWDQMKNSLLRKSQSTAFIRFSAEIGEGADETETQGKLVDFVEIIFPHIEAALKGSLGG